MPNLMVYHWKSGWLDCSFQYPDVRSQLDGMKLQEVLTDKDPFKHTRINFNLSLDVRLHPLNYKVWDEIAYPLKNFNGAAVKLLEGVN